MTDKSKYINDCCTFWFSKIHSKGWPGHTIFGRGSAPACTFIFRTVERVSPLNFSKIYSRLAGPHNLLGRGSAPGFTFILRTVERVSHLKSYRAAATLLENHMVKENRRNSGES